MLARVSIHERKERNQCFNTTVQIAMHLCQNQNQNNLLVKRQNDNIGRGRLVPSSNKGSKFRYTIVGQFSRGDERAREDIPVPDSLGKETFLVGIFTSSGNLNLNVAAPFFQQAGVVISPFICFNALGKS